MSITIGLLNVFSPECGQLDETMAAFTTQVSLRNILADEAMKSEFRAGPSPS
jgi:hypothetical protein